MRYEKEEWLAALTGLSVEKCREAIESAGGLRALMRERSESDLVHQCGLTPTAALKIRAADTLRRALDDDEIREARDPASRPELVASHVYRKH